MQQFCSLMRILQHGSVCVESDELADPHEAIREAHSQVHSYNEQLPRGFSDMVDEAPAAEAVDTAQCNRSMMKYMRL